MSRIMVRSETFQTTLVYTIGYLYVIGVLLHSFVASMGPIVLDLIMPLNESRPTFFPFKIEIFVDRNDHVIPVLTYCYIVIIISMSILGGVDTIYSLQLHYACAILAELS